MRVFAVYVTREGRGRLPYGTGAAVFIPALVANSLARAFRIV